ncbi:hypothetical protein HN011_011876 [Eciton burchellii]|nr:hypothetical protein HN011_011876 [Eciton burchellii]
MLMTNAKDRFENQWSIQQFACINCKSVYNKKSSLTTHLRYECGQPPRFKCPYCDLVSKKTSNVHQHIRRKHKSCMVYVQDILIFRLTGKTSANGRTFRCPNCTNVFSRQKGLRKHLIYECGQPPRFQCPYCNHRSKLILNLYKHVRRRHCDRITLLDWSFFGTPDVLTASRREVKFPCPSCNSVFNRKNNLQKHLKYECGQLPRFKCPYCVYLSKKTSNVRAHIRGLHPDCSVNVIDLNKNLLHLGDFKISKNRHKFPCPKCRSAFSRKNNLYSHLKFECGQLPRFGCPYCMYISKKSSNVRAHIRRKHDGLNYCVFAPMPVTHGYVFPPPYSSSFTTTKVPTTTTMTMMSAMIKTNTGAKMLNKKFYCANCSSGFSRKGGLTYHQKFECGQQPRFSCPYCVYCARHISNARRHVRKCHPGQDSERSQESMKSICFAQHLWETECRHVKILPWLSIDLKLRRMKRRACPFRASATFSLKTEDNVDTEY